MVVQNQGMRLKQATKEIKGFIKVLQSVEIFIPFI